MWFEMEPEEVEAVLQTICDLHDKVSDAIHALSRAHFLRSVRLRAAGGDKPAGLVCVKVGVLAADDGDEAAASAAMAEEARSLHAIRAALEDLEDQLEYFHTVQSQQQAEREIALAKLEQSRIILAIRLREHQGKNYQLIDEALDFVHNVYQEVWPLPSVNMFEKPRNHSGAGSTSKKDSNFFLRVVASSLSSVRNGLLSIDKVGGLLGNSAILAISMIALLQLHKLISRGQTPSVGNNYNYKKMNQESYSPSGTSRHGAISHLDVSLAKG